MTERCEKFASPLQIVWFLVVGLEATTGSSSSESFQNLVSFHYRRKRERRNCLDKQKLMAELAVSLRLVPNYQYL